MFSSSFCKQIYNEELKTMETKATNLWKTQYICSSWGGGREGVGIVGLFTLRTAQTEQRESRGKNLQLSVLKFESVIEIRKYDRSFKRNIFDITLICFGSSNYTLYQMVLRCQYTVCGRNPNHDESKRKLSADLLQSFYFLRHCLLCCTRQF